MIVSDLAQRDSSLEIRRAFNRVHRGQLVLREASLHER